MLPYLRVFLSAICVLCLPAALAAQTLSMRAASGSPEIIAPVSTVVRIRVLLDSGRAGGVIFSAPVPPLLSGKLNWLADEAQFPGTVGISQASVTVPLPACTTGPVHILTMVFRVADGVSCVEYPFGSTDIINCFGGHLQPASQSAWVTSVVANVHDRTPLDGATNVPLDADISWQETFCYTGLADIYAVPIYFGTTSDPPQVAWLGGVMRTWDPGPLQPQTTYYWRFEPWFVSGTQAPVWSFTTMAGVPTVPTPWGQIKQRYR